LNRAGFAEVRQPVVTKYHVFRVPTFPSAKGRGTIVQLELGVAAGVGPGAGVELGEHPESVLSTDDAPSLTVTRQVLERKLEASTWKDPAESARPVAVDSGEDTVTVAPATAPRPRRAPGRRSARPA
jgi:hypothetical protein